MVELLSVIQEINISYLTPDNMPDNMKIHSVVFNWTDPVPQNMEVNIIFKDIPKQIRSTL